MSLYTVVMNSPIGDIEVKAKDDYLISIKFISEGSTMNNETNHPLLLETLRQLEEFFEGERKSFNLPMEINGTSFQKEVWKALEQIPYGETWSYQDVACAIQNPKAVRAIGQANKANRFPILIPCHRVIGKNNTLTGYAGNQVEKKEYLLSLESK